MARRGAFGILVARFLYFCMDIGLTKSFGVLIPELEEQLQTSNALVGLITSLSLATMYLGCPITKLLLDRCPRPRLLTSACGLLAGCALIATAFTRNIATLSALFFTVGLSCSVVNLQAIVLLHDYYQEDFPFASCVSVLGIPVGAAILPPLTEKLLEAYGLSGTLLVDGALVLNMLPIGIMLKVARDRPRGHVSEKSLEAGRDVFDPLMSDKDSVGTSSRESAQEVLELTEPRRTRDCEVTKDAVCAGEKCSSGSEQCLSLRLVSSKDGGDSSFKKDMVVVYTSPGEKSSVCGAGIFSRLASWLGRCLAFIHLDVLIKEPLLSLLYLPNIILLYVVTGGWALFIVLYAIEHGIDMESAAYLATAGAVGGIASSILMSVALWYRLKWSPYLYLACLLLGTVCIFLQTVYSSYIYLVSMSFLIGFGIFGSHMTIEAILSETVAKENFPDASSLFFFAVGLGYMLSGYVAGFVQDLYGNTEILFFFLGSTSVVALLLLIILIICLRRRESRSSKNISKL